jgi:hypothetical protein
MTALDNPIEGHFTAWRQFERSGPGLEEAAAKTDCRSHIIDGRIESDRFHDFSLNLPGPSDSAFVEAEPFEA